jgi:DNA-binding NtrC family response regulator
MYQLDSTRTGSTGKDNKPGLLIVDDDPLITDTLQFALSPDFSVHSCSTRVEAVAYLRSRVIAPQLALVDLGLPPTPQLPFEGFQLIAELLAHAPAIKILVLSGQSDESNARHARTLGAIDLVPKPCEPEYLKSLLFAALKVQASETRAADDKEADKCHLIGDSPPLQKLKSQITLYAASQHPALIEGESGSGKERVAACLHLLSPRGREPYLALNCAAISPTLVEPTLFGYAKGSFTGANASKSGYFEDAGQGTLFLDEIGELPLDLQPKLLRVLENGEFQRVGETQTRVSKARIIAATNRDLRREIKAGRFRADLYHRLSVFNIGVPPLRELADDRVLLLDHFRHFYAAQAGTPAFTLDNKGLEAWRTYPFPGNVRELKNIVIRLNAKHAGRILGSSDVEDEFDLDAYAETAAAATPGGAKRPVEEAKSRLLLDSAFNLDEALREVERVYVEAALDMSHGNVSQAAKLLGVNRTTLYSRMDLFGKIAPAKGSGGR